MTFNFGTGRVTYFTMAAIDPAKPLAEQVLLFDEDLAQVEYPNGYLLDIGWYPAWEIDGQFCVKVIRNFDWVQPVVAVSCRDLALLHRAVAFCVGVTEALSCEA